MDKIQTKSKFELNFIWNLNGKRKREVFPMGSKQPIVHSAGHSQAQLCGPSQRPLTAHAGWGAARACPECMHHAPVRGHYGQARHLAHLPSAKWRWTLGTGGRETISGAQPLRRYTRTHSRWLGRGSSPVEWLGWRKPNDDKVKLGVQRTEVSETKIFYCKGQEGDMKRWFGYLVGDEKHDGEELTVDGGQCSCDPTWRTE
jgi:hypothetical protein